MQGNNNIFYETKHLNLTFYLDAANSTIWHVNEKLFVLKYNDIFEARKHVHIKQQQNAVYPIYTIPLKNGTDI